MNDTSKAWICLVCGYIHRADTAPDTCPVCGAPKTDFEAHHASPPPSKRNAKQWHCLICGFIHDGPTPPDRCPVCAAASDDFESVTETDGTDSVSDSDARAIAIIGAGIAGVSAAEQARQKSPNADVILYSEETELPYYRLNLTRYLAGEVEQDALPMHEQTWYKEQRIRLELGVKVTAVTPAAHTLELSTGESVSWDKLVFACGAHPFVPPIPGVDKSGVFAVRTRQDADALLAHIESDVSCVCIGGGILGLETAGALAKQGASVTILEGFGHLLPRQLNPEAAQVLARHIADLGIEVRTSANTREIIGEKSVSEVALDSGDKLPAHVVTVTTGVRPNSHLARRAGLKVNNGILVDSRLVSSHPDIYAVGDVAEWDGIVYGLWEPAHYQGVIAGQNAAGADLEFGGLPRMNTLKVLGIDLFSAGVIMPEDGSYLEITELADGVYRRFLFHDNTLAGVILIGDTTAAAALVRALKERTDMSALLAKHPGASDIVAHLMDA